ncbi:hypothetical protein AB0E25_33290 [Streptomyces bobili]|uniref:hypothetical protein n=1 Tax=Streptomyces bobili TaxID=67280 RepID=UPI0033F5700E
MTDQTSTPESARHLLDRHGLPEDVIDGALALHAQELAAVQRQAHDASGYHMGQACKPEYECGVRATIDLIDPTRPAAVPVPPPAGTDHRAQLLDALDFAYCQGLGYDTPEALLDAYDVSRGVSVPPPADQTAPLAEVWVVWREDESPYGHFATEDAAKRATIDCWEEDEPSCPDYSWRRDGPRWELVVGGEHGGVYASRHRVYGTPETVAAVAVLPEQTDRAAVPLTAVERQFLTFALDLAFDRMVSDGGFTSEDEAALETLRQMAAEEQPTETQDGFELRGTADIRAAALLEAANALAALGPTDSLVSAPKAWNEAIGVLRNMAAGECAHGPERHGPEAGCIECRCNTTTGHAVVEQPEAQEARCPAKHGALGRICELPPGHSGMHTGSGPNGGAVWQGDAP